MLHLDAMRGFEKRYLRPLIRIVVPSDNPCHGRRHLLPIDNDLSEEIGSALQTGDDGVLFDAVMRETVCDNPGSGANNARLLKISQSRHQRVGP